MANPLKDNPFQLSDLKCNRMPLRLHNIQSIPSAAFGVYAFLLRTTGRCIYIGKAVKQPIKVRLEQEWRNSHNPALKRWIAAFGSEMDFCYLVLEKGIITRAESYLIATWHPETNIKGQRR